MERCEHEYREKKLLPKGSSHYGKIVCAHCGTFIQWMPFPTELGDVAVPDCDDGPMPDLVGSAAQIKWALSLRPVLLSQLEGNVPHKLFLAARQIREAAWWIANRSRPVAALRWPPAWQQDAPQPQGEALDSSPPPSSPVRSGFDVSLEPSAERCVLRVTFDGGRSSGSFTLTLEELTKVQRAISSYLVSKRLENRHLVSSEE